MPVKNLGLYLRATIFVVDRVPLDRVNSTQSNKPTKTHESALAVDRPGPMFRLGLGVVPSAEPCARADRYLNFCTTVDRVTGTGTVVDRRNAAREKFANISQSVAPFSLGLYRHLYRHLTTMAPLQQHPVVHARSSYEGAATVVAVHATAATADAVGLNNNDKRPVVVRKQQQQRRACVNYVPFLLLPFFAYLQYTSDVSMMEFVKSASRKSMIRYESYSLAMESMSASLDSRGGIIHNAENQNAHRPPSLRVLIAQYSGAAGNGTYDTFLAVTSKINQAYAIAWKYDYLILKGTPYVAPHFNASFAVERFVVDGQRIRSRQ